MARRKEPNSMSIPETGSSSGPAHLFDEDASEFKFFKTIEDIIVGTLRFISRFFLTIWILCVGPSRIGQILKKPPKDSVVSRPFTFLTISVFGFVLIFRDLTFRLRQTGHLFDLPKDSAPLANLVDQVSVTNVIQLTFPAFIAVFLVTLLISRLLTKKSLLRWRVIKLACYANGLMFFLLFLAGFLNIAYEFVTLRLDDLSGNIFPKPMNFWDSPLSLFGWVLLLYAVIAPIVIFCCSLPMLAIRFIRRRTKWVTAFASLALPVLSLVGGSTALIEFDQEIRKNFEDKPVLVIDLDVISAQVKLLPNYIAEFTFILINDGSRPYFVKTSEVIIGNIEISGRDDHDHGSMIGAAEMSITNVSWSNKAGGMQIVNPKEGEWFRIQVQLPHRTKMLWDPNEQRSLKFQLWLNVVTTPGSPEGVKTREFEVRSQDIERQKDA